MAFLLWFKIIDRKPFIYPAVMDFKKVIKNIISANVLWTYTIFFRNKSFNYSTLMYRIVRSSTTIVEGMISSEYHHFPTSLKIIKQRYARGRDTCFDPTEIIQPGTSFFDDRGCVIVDNITELFCVCHYSVISTDNLTTFGQ